MKRMILMMILTATVSAVMAQQEPLPGTPAAGGASIKAVPTATGTSVTNMGVRPDMAKVQAIYAELGTISKELRPQEEKLQASDPEFKTLTEKLMVAQQALRDLDTQRRDLMDTKLSADPALAPLVAKRRELQQALKDMRPAGFPGGANMQGPRNGFGPRRMAPDGSDQPIAPRPPAATPAPVPVPEKAPAAAPGDQAK